MTVKIEPELLQRIQTISDSRGISVSYYVREAVIDHIRDLEEELSPDSLRIDLTLMERNVLTQLIRIGVLGEPQELFHKSFDSYIASDLERIISFANRLNDMREFPSTVPLTKRRMKFQEVDDLGDDDLEGDR
jgi:hypothetical protein